ncbi:tetratricopeptide repeat protein [Candidatus Beckwithbacteria bacterium]|nr:tetratricopeptide repeat protein [Candidatus Beckwithbacteria bacterium]
MEEQSLSHPISAFITKAALILLVIYTFAIPLVISPMTAANVFDFPKWLITIGTALIMIIFTGVYMILERKIILPAKRYLIPLVLLAGVLLISIFVNQPVIVTPFYGKSGLLLALIAIVFSSLVLIKDKIKPVLLAFIASSFLVSLMQILAFFEVLGKILTAPMYGQKIFTPVGSQVALLSFLIMALAATLVYSLKVKQVGQKVLLFVVAGLQTIALVFAVAQILPGQDATPRYLPYASGWSIAVDQLKNGKTAFLGVGPENFAMAFSKFRPVVLNQSDGWFIRFGASSNEWLTVFTTLGLVGLAAMILLALTFVKAALTGYKKSTAATAVSVAFVASLLITLIIPANTVLLAVFFIFGTLLLNLKKDKATVVESGLAIAPAAILILGSVILGVFVVRASMAEAAFGQSLQYAAENRGTDTYNAQIRAIQLNPYMQRYHLSYSNTNLALANALATKEKLTDDDRQKITQLISQSIREGKAAVALDPDNSNSWVNLAKIYRQLINFAQGADQWAITSYIQAIRLDNTNPQLRLDFGGLLYSLGRYEEAIDQFKQAIVLKPDYANAYYNLSNAYKQTGQNVQAYAAMQNVVQLIDPNSADHDKAVNELNELQKLLPAELQQATTAATKRESQLTEPEPTPTPRPTQVNFEEGEQQELAPEVENGFGELNQQEATPAAQVEGGEQ